MRLLIPGTAFALAERLAPPVFLPPPLPKDATPWTLLSWGSTPLHGMSRSSLLSTPATRAVIESHSLGVPCPYGASGNESPRLDRLRQLPSSTGRAPRPFPSPCKHGPVVGPGIHWWLPTHQLRSRSQVFPTSQRPSSSRLRPTIFRWVALVGLRPPGGYTFHEAPTARRRRHTLLTFFPTGALPLFLGRGSIGHASRT